MVGRNNSLRTQSGQRQTQKATIQRITYLLGSSSEANAGVGSVVDGIIVLQELLANDSVDTLDNC